MFRTILNIGASKLKINIKDTILSLGSCFAINTGEKLTDFKFDVQINPFGTIFNPISIFKLLQLSLNQQILREDGFVRSQGAWFHYDLHSDVSALEKWQLIDLFEQRRQLTLDYIQKSSLIILTFGTAIVYEHRLNDELVANCHKIPADQFNKVFLETEEIILGFDQVYQALKLINPKLWFIISVSPVRHIKDSFEKNNVSKSVLRLSAEQLSTKYDDVIYFPSFEIMMDDLRDYRFYAEDMLHPNQVAIDYIWTKFSTMFFDKITLKFINDWSKIQKSLAHSAFHPGSSDHQEFLKQTIKQIEGFRSLVNIDRELELLKQQLL